MPCASFSMLDGPQWLLEQNLVYDIKGLECWSGWDVEYSGWGLDCVMSCSILSLNVIWSFKILCIL